MILKPAVNGAEAVLHEIEEQAKQRFLPIIGPHKGRLLAEEVRKAAPRLVLEVGTLVGYSAILMGKEMAKGSEIVTIEVHQGEAEQATENIQTAQIPARVTVMVGNALDVIPTLRGPFDLAFIDAEKIEYLQYLLLAEQKLRSGAVVFADNAGVFGDQMQDYLAYVRGSGKYQSRYVQVGDDGVEISMKQ